MSINNLKENLQVSHGTVSAWLDSLTKLYLICFFTAMAEKDS
ncbi:MAG: hypothetical protein SWO11_11255 [Thermodesulfobacteriota bacterium]|nr:hypothetical protein [Thermodesulfobacteriota bacterium]